jgi:hypothetical protein
MGFSGGSPFHAANQQRLKANAVFHRCNIVA